MLQYYKLNISLKCKLRIIIETSVVTKVAETAIEEGLYSVELSVRLVQIQHEGKYME